MSRFPALFESPAVKCFGDVCLLYVAKSRVQDTDLATYRNHTPPKLCLAEPAEAGNCGRRGTLLHAPETARS